MHDPDASGTDFFKCDFCHAAWQDENPMVEGHRGSLICLRCLSVAYDRLVTHTDPDADSTESCVMCLEARQQPVWVSPITDVHACLRCVKLAARALERDDETDWLRPGSASTDA